MSEPAILVSRNGETFAGALGLPAGSEAAPTVVVLQEYWGLTPHIEAIVDRWADAGFVAVAPDLYRGTIAATATEAGALMGSLDRSRALADIGGAIDFARRHSRSNGAVVITGYCMGGAFTLAAAAVEADLSAAIAFYGLPPDSTNLGAIRAPVQMHVASHDNWVTPAAADAAAKAIRAGGASVEVHLYDANHAFCNDTRPDVYDLGCAAEAWQRAVAFAREKTRG